MTLENQAREIALAVSNYCKSFSVEPAAALRKPCSVILAALDLEIVTRREVQAHQQAYADEQPQYTEEGFEHNERGDPTRTHKTAIIPLRGLAENKRASSDLQSVIDKFK